MSLFMLTTPIPPDLIKSKKTPGAWTGCAQPNRDRVMAPAFGDLYLVENGILTRVRVHHENARQRPEYGANVKRDIYIRPANEGDEIDEGISCWEEIFGPVQPWEAWRVAEMLTMQLQGIELKAKDGYTYRAFNSQAGDLLFSREADGKSESLNRAVALTRESYNRLSCKAVRLQNTCQWLPHTLTDILKLLYLGEIAEVPKGAWGWRVANIWRLDAGSLNLQAQAFGLRKVEYLLKRIKRRKAAAKRKKSA